MIGAAQNTIAPAQRRPVTDRQEERTEAFAALMQAIGSAVAPAEIASAGLASQVNRQMANAASVSVADQAASELQTQGEKAETATPRPAATGDSPETRGEPAASAASREGPQAKPKIDPPVSEKPQPQASTQHPPAKDTLRGADAPQTREPAPTANQTPQPTTSQASAAPIVAARAASTAAPSAAPAAPGPSPVSSLAPLSAAARRHTAPLATPRPAAPPRQELPPEAAKVLGRVRQALESAAQERGGAITLRLTPRQLGEVHVRVEMVQDRVSAEIAAGTDRARRILRRHLDDLRSSLSARGLRVDSLKISADPTGWMPAEAKTFAERVNPELGGTTPEGGDSPDGRSTHGERGRHEHPGERAEPTRPDDIQRDHRTTQGQIGLIDALA